MPGVVVKFSIDETIPPVRNAYFNVPAAFREAAKQRLKQMEEQDIIEQVTTAPNWISGMSAVPKGKTDFRLVVNMRAANKAIKREYFRMPLIDDMTIKLHGAKYFSKLDLSNAFYHLELSPESRDLTTFLSESGMYRFKRLMFGVNCAPEIFQREMTNILKDEKNIIVYIDDILIFGAVLVQEDIKGLPRVISFASKAFTSTEKRYAQNQREALGAVWGVEHFSYFLLGRHFLLRTDAQRVAFILNRSRENTKRALTRADGWALRLSPYSYDVQYIRGCDNIADPSSRLYIANDEPFDEACSPWEIASVESNCFEFLTEAEVREATANDEILQQVIVALETGKWLKSLRKYELVAKDLTVSNGRASNVCKNEKHSSQRVWWPGITADAEEWVDTCQVCATTGRPEKPTPMKRSLVPKTAWHSIALDFNGPHAKLGGVSILVVVDYRSRYLIARPVKSTSFENTKKVLDNIFEREGYPQNIKSDNGPPFNGEDYKAYCRERGINTIFSTPLFPQQNGLVEGYMKLVNKAMATALSSGTSYEKELQDAVDAHNAAAHTVTRIPPEEIMMGRKIRRHLPLLLGKQSDHDEDLINTRDRQAKLRSKEYEDSRRGARECRIKPGDVVITERLTRTKGDTRFDPTKLTVVAHNNGNLVLCDNSGRNFRRHVTQTCKVREWRDREPVEENETHEQVESRRCSNRDRKPPAYLESYVRVCELEDLNRREFR
ncbi:uncharacterized protein K02A2.6-like [Wyeomyia smithii]|uniref:uncharacterized protein K02A2.6-like n=1 Tax=Wyeomyia smithii TaxID=174621 RepID=UPI0024680044|nr:uncharacterized protein K02A2.6-like [Wyeomyia smithii]